MARLRLIPVITLLLALSACATPPLPVGKPIPPGYLYKAKFLDIHSPNADGWYMAGATQSGIQFIHHGNNKGEMFAAQVSTFPLPVFKNADAFVDFIRQSFHTDTDPKRFTTVKSSFRISHARKYLCVRVSAVIKDRQAAASAKHQRKLKLQSISLYCRHPVNQLAGFAIIYSHRGKSLYPDMAKQANDFIAGVQVPGH